MIELRITSSPEDVAAFSKEAGDDLPGAKTYEAMNRHVIRQWSGVFVMYAVLFAFAAWKLYSHGADKVIVVMFLVLSVAQAYQIVAMRRQTRREESMRRTHEAWSAAGMYDMLRTPVLHRISETGIESSTDKYTTHYSWKCIDMVIETPNYVGAVMHSSSAFIFPKAVVQGTLPAADFLAQVQSWHRDHGPTNIDLIEQYTANRDVPCPSCEYNLRGIRSEVCPECSQKLDFDELRVAEVARHVKKRR